ncbi:MAG: C1 family peptidase [Candidatus Kapaibacterium sp.]
MRRLFIILLPFVIFAYAANADEPRRDKGKLQEYPNPFWEKIKESTEKYQKEEEEEKLSFKMDMQGYNFPTDKEEYKYYWHNEPISQGWTGTCWCFATTSFFESEVYRLHGKKLDFSEIYTVYWEYVEKARRFIRERGDSHFGEGSQANAVRRMWRMYGCVPAEAYPGKPAGQEYHAHNLMYKEMKQFLESVKERNDWNEEAALETIKSILNYYLGAPPEFVTVDGERMTPREYLEKVVKIKPDDYVDVLSILEKPYWQKVEHDVPDNWWNSETYNNVPLNEFMESIKSSVKNGYTMMIGGDVSETGYNSKYEVAVVPSYDIPSEYIDEYARQFRVSNGTTTDDHAIHLVGYKENDDGFWFLIKDSGSGSRNGKNIGYYFYHEDYIKLKLMNFFIHKSAVKDLISKIAVK